MVKEEFYFDSRDGKSRIHAVRYSPDRERQVRCVFQIVHGMAEYAERYEEFAEYLTAEGYVVTGEDHLGHGRSVTESGKYGYFCEQDPATVLVRDVHRLKKMTQELYPDVPYVIMGHSMGSFITRNYMCRYGTGIAGAVVMGTGMQPLPVLYMAKALVKLQKLFCGPEHVSRFIDKLAFGAYNKKIHNPETDWDWLSRDSHRVRQYMEDPLCGFTFTVNGFGTLFELISRIYKRKNLRKMPPELPVFLISGDGDPVGSYGRGVERTCDSLTCAGIENITMKLYPGGRHELLNETNRREVMKDIRDWVENEILKER